MSKRRSENGQMRREEYEAEDDEITSESFEKGFQRASEESIRQRKIVKARVGGPMSRPSAVPKPSVAAVTTSSAATSAAGGSANPFSGFQGLTAGAPAAPKANPFAGFSGLTADKPTVSTPPATPVASAFGGSSSSSAAAPKTASSSYQEAIEVLNKDFLSFVNDQARQNPSASWIAAVQEYVKYADEIAAKHASTKPVPIDQQQTKSAAPSFTSIPSFLTSIPTNGSAKSPVSTSGFSFGAKSDDKKAESKSVPAATNSGFSFGTAKKDDDAKPASTGGFSFGAAKKDDDSKSASTGGFSFGGAKKDDDSKPATSTGSFAFGATKKDDSAKPANTGGFSFGSTKKDDAKPVASTGGFSFGSSKPDTDKAPAVAPAFSFGGTSSFSTPSPAAPAASTGGFSFGNLASSSSASAPATKPFSFGSSGASSFGTSAGASSAAAPAANDDDDENIGREEATVIIKSDSPDDDAVFDVEKAKVFEFKKDEKRWADKGLHPLKVLVNKSTKKARILVRNEIGKIVLNSSLYKGMSVKAHETKGKKTGVIVSLQVADAMTQYLLKVNAAKVDEFIAVLDKAAANS